MVQIESHFNELPFAPSRDRLVCPAPRPQRALCHKGSLGPFDPRHRVQQSQVSWTSPPKRWNESCRLEKTSREASYDDVFQSLDFLCPVIESSPYRPQLIMWCKRRKWQRYSRAQRSMAISLMKIDLFQPQAASDPIFPTHAARREGRQPDRQQKHRNHRH